MSTGLVMVGASNRPVHFRHSSTPEAFLKKLTGTTNSPAHTEELMQFAAIWASQSPKAAAEAMLKLPPGDDRDRALGQVIAIWAKEYPQAAIEWLAANQGDLPSFILLASQAYSLWAGHDASAAAQYALAHDANPEAIKAILAVWSQNQPANADTFFFSQLNDAQRAQVAGSFLLAVAATDPVTTQNLIDYLAVSSLDAQQLASLANSLARVSPASALSLANELPAGEIKNNLLEELKNPPAPIQSAVASRTADPNPDVIITQDSTLPPANSNGLVQHKISP